MEFFWRLSSFAEKVLEIVGNSESVEVIDLETILRNITSEQKSAIASAFSDYIWEYVENGM